MPTISLSAVVSSRCVGGFESYHATACGDGDEAGRMEERGGCVMLVRRRVFAVVAYVGTPVEVRGGALMAAIVKPCSFA